MGGSDRERRKPSLGPKSIYNCASYYTIFFFQIIKNRQVATVSVFILSAIVHEYVLLFAFRFFYPILLIMFGAFGCKYIGVVFISFKCEVVIFFHCDIDDDDSDSGGDGAACIVGERKNVTLEGGGGVSLSLSPLVSPSRALFFHAPISLSSACCAF